LKYLVPFLLMGFLAGCDEPPEGGWGPAAGQTQLAEGDVSRVRVSADGREVEVPLGAGQVRRQQLPGLTGAGLDVGGVGAFPGAEFDEVELRVPGPRADGARLLVSMPFTAPAKADAVLDWYQAAFAARGRPVQRDNLVLNGQTKSGDGWTLAMTAGEGRESRGEIRLRRQ